MSTSWRTYLWIGVAVMLAAMSGCQREVHVDTNTYRVKLSFQHVVGSSPLNLNSPYLNPQLEPYTITTFKYYISNISFTTDAGVEVKVPDSYYLVDEKTASSKSFTVSVPSNQFSKVNFLIGVDSVRNVSGVQTGALDPANGMFWTWSTGYIMAKLEGSSPLSTAPSNAVTYHVGGFSGDQNVVKKVSLLLPTALNIAKGGTSEVVIAADANAWFSGASDIRIATDATCTNPGPLASRLAANYANMFIVKQVIN